MDYSHEVFFFFYFFRTIDAQESFKEFAQKSVKHCTSHIWNFQWGTTCSKFKSRAWLMVCVTLLNPLFSHLKTAEQDAARLALKCLSRRTQHEAPSLVYEVCRSKIVGVDFSRCSFSWLIHIDC